MLKNKSNNEISPTLSDKFIEAFFSISFSNHYLIASKSKSIEEAQFYIYKTANEFLSYRALQQHLKNNLFSQQGKLPNNFGQTLPYTASNKAVQVFKDEYLLDFINIEDPDEADEKLIENEIVRNIKKFILCKEKNNKVVEYSFRDFNKAMGVATYKTSKEIPDKYRNILPDAETLKKLME